MSCKCCLHAPTSMFCRYKKDGDVTLEPMEELVIDVDQVLAICCQYHVSSP